MLISRPTAISTIFGVFQVISLPPWGWTVFYYLPMQRKEIARTLSPRSQGEIPRRTALPLAPAKLGSKHSMADKNTSAKLCNRDLGSRSRSGNALIPNQPFWHAVEELRGGDRFGPGKTRRKLR
jgi:hypothetical protein